MFPRKLELEDTETRVSEWQHLQKVAEVRRKKAVTERQALIDKIKGVTVTFKSEAGAADKIFGAITNLHISEKLEELGFSIDKRDIELEEPIKVLGQHKAKVKLGDKLEAEVTIVVERLG